MVFYLLKYETSVWRNDLSRHIGSRKEETESSGYIGNISDEALGNGSGKGV